MPATIDGLAADLRRFFEEKLPAGPAEGPGSVSLIFDALGSPLSVPEFTGPEAAPSSQIFARQRAAELADQLPAANTLAAGSYLPRGGGRLSDWYALMVNAAVGAGAAFDLAKAAALRDLENNKQVVLGGAIDTRYLTTMSPPDFFRPEFDGWQQYSVKAGDEPPPAVRPGPRIPLLTTPFEGPMHSGILIHGTLAESLVGLNDPNPPLPVRERGALAAGTDFRHLGRLPVESTTSIIDAPDDAVVPLIRAIEPRVALAEAVARFDPALNASAAAAVLAEATKVPATSGNFEVSFDYCFVRFERPWWSEIFLSRTDWRVDQVGKGMISTGSSVNPTGPVTLITSGMLVVRKLTIKANWSQQDLEVLPSSPSLGPFCLVAGNFEKSSGTLVREGLQVIAWLCEVPPILPPAD